MTETPKKRKPVPKDQPSLFRARPTRVMIVDDHQLMRDAIHMLLDSKPGLEVCGEAEDGITAMQQFRKLRPDMVIVDLGLTVGDGLDLIKEIKACDGSVRVIVCSMYDERLYGERALRAGAEGYVSKGNKARTILDAIKCVLEGKLYFSEDLTDRLLRHAQQGREDLAQSPVDTLSDRELQVFRLIGEGLKSTEIGARLHLSASTVDTYRDRLKRKFHVNNGSELTRLATLWLLKNP